MKLRIALPVLLLGLMARVASRAQTPITITSADMFNKVGQYYRAYANVPNSTVAVTSLLGTATNVAQVWDFSTGPQDLTNRFDYIAALNGARGSDFADAGSTIAEQKTDEGTTNSLSWLYFSQDPVKGRLDYGFYDPTFSTNQPESIFTNALQDFPATIHFGDTWSGHTVFDSIADAAGGLPDQLVYSSTDIVDAYGIIITPTFGFLDCLRVHELVEYDLYFDLGLGDGLQEYDTQFIINYYWLAQNHGIVAQITSNPSDNTPPSDDLPNGAAAIVRMFETNHGQEVITNPPPTIANFKLTLGGTGGLLSWTASPALKSYQVEYSTNLNGAWQTLATTTSSFVIDPAAGAKQAPSRLYRVLGN